MYFGHSRTRALHESPQLSEGTPDRNHRSVSHTRNCQQIPTNFATLHPS
jgi:hypothetical protein